MYAPQSWKDATPEERRAEANGCGPEGWRHDLWPRGTVDFGPACDIHDWMYGKRLGREYADAVFWLNLKRLVAAHGGPWRAWNLFVAWLYWRAVVRAGALFYER